MLLLVCSFFTLRIFSINATLGQSTNSLPTVNAPSTLGQNASGMAVLNQTVYISLPGMVVIATPTTAKEKWIQSNFTYAGLEALCRFNATNLLLVTSTELLLYDIASGATSVLVSGLSNAQVCTTNGDNGDVYVSDSLQVQKFTSSGKYVMTFGTAGGRYIKNPNLHFKLLTFFRPLAAVPYNPNQLLEALYLSVGPDGNLYIVERNVAPTRYAVFNAQNGTWIRDYYGPIG